MGEKTAAKTLELWDGFTVKVNEQLLDDFDFNIELQKAQKENDVGELISMYFALIGGEEVYEKCRQHIEDEKGYFSTKSLLEIIEKVNALFPKAQRRVERRGWRSQK